MSYPTEVYVVRYKYMCTGSLFVESVKTMCNSNAKFKQIMKRRNKKRDDSEVRCYKVYFCLTNDTSDFLLLSF